MEVIECERDQRKGIISLFSVCCSCSFPERGTSSARATTSVRDQAERINVSPYGNLNCENSVGGVSQRVLCFTFTSPLSDRLSVRLSVCRTHTHRGLSERTPAWSGDTAASLWPCSPFLSGLPSSRRWNMKKVFFLKLSQTLTDGPITQTVTPLHVVTTKLCFTVV